MKVVEIVNGKVHREYPEFDTAEDAYKIHARTVLFVDAPDHVLPGYLYDESREGDERFYRPILADGFEYTEDGRIWNPEVHRMGERTSLHAATTNDTLQALRKIREGDTTYDWSAWLDRLDAYNMAIEDTKKQDGYPYKVTYPEYPSR